LSDDAPLTELLQAWSAGDAAAREALLPRVYGELRRRAHGYLRRERPGHTLQPTALVHEVYLRLASQHVEWQDRGHFFGLASRLMRRILVDHARQEGRAKRGGGAFKVELSEDVAGAAPAADVDLAALDEALEELSRLDPRQGQIVELRYFGGLSIDETASVLGLSPATVKRDWTLARAFLHQRLRA
jgi:RNA polymerase sigma factor (TIGR02999 family)